MRVCARCGAEASDESCPLCGSTDIELVQSTPSPAAWTPAPPTPRTPATPPPPTPAAASATTSHERPTQSHGNPINRVYLIVGGVIVALILIVLVAIGGQSGKSSNTAAGAPKKTTAPTSTTVRSPSVRPPSATRTPTPTRSVDPEIAAKAELDKMIAANRATVPLGGQWAAMLAGKWIGIEDPLQTNAEGGHVFGAADILREHKALKARISGAEVVLLDSRTFGNHIDHNGEPLYVTIGLSNSFVDRQSILTWCAEQFPELDGANLENQCTPSRLAP